MEPKSTEDTKKDEEELERILTFLDAAIFRLDKQKEMTGYGPTEKLLRAYKAIEDHLIEIYDDRRRGIS